MLWIRADGNAETGAGHLMRCLSVAEELAALQGDRESIHFLCADGQSAALAVKQEFVTHVLGTDYRDMESELPQWQKLSAGLCGEGRAERQVILVDSYHVTDTYLAALKELGYVVLMDDFGKRTYPVDCVINYNAQASMEHYQKLYQGREVRLLIGSSYAPLRRQFRNISPPNAADRVRNVLITAGGGDAGNIAGEILDEIYREDMTYYIVIGQFNPHYQSMKELEGRCSNIHICHNVTDMAGLMCGCDIAVTAGGSTVYELAAVGVPFICFSCAENQEALVEHIERESIACSAGAWHKDAAGTRKRTGRLFEELAADKGKRAQCSRKERAMADGLGALRLARVLKEAIRI